MDSGGPKFSQKSRVVVELPGARALEASEVTSGTERAASGGGEGRDGAGLGVG